jgi:hypothetical protein
MRRADGENIKMSRELDRNYLQPVTDTQRLTREYIDRYRANKASEWETEIFTQRRRLGIAERSLAVQENKKAREDVRIATKKVTALLERLAVLRRSEPAEGDDRIFPAMYVPLIVMENGRRVIKPMRYACRLAGKPADYDQRFPGTYNARRDSLTGFWNNVYGRRHGLMVVSGFYENVPVTFMNGESYRQMSRHRTWSSSSIRNLRSRCWWPACGIDGPEQATKILTHLLPSRMSLRKRSPLQATSAASSV